MASHRCPSCGTDLSLKDKKKWVCNYENCRFPWSSEKAPMTREQRQQKMIHDLQYKVDVLEINADLRKSRIAKLELRLDDLISHLCEV